MDSTAENTATNTGPEDVIIFLGNYLEQETCERVERALGFGISERDFTVDNHYLTFVKVPPRKVKKFLDEFPIHKGCLQHPWATHTWEGATA